MRRRFMMMVAGAIILSGWSWVTASRLQSGHDAGILSFEERVRCQAAVERINYLHRIWPKDNPEPKPPFEEMAPRAAIESTVRESLRKSALLELVWQRPITAVNLQAEMDRMANQTKDPEMLQELFAALDNDPGLIAECLARPVLADRLLSNWYARDGRIHESARIEAESIHDLLTPDSFEAIGGDRFHRIVVELAEPDRTESESDRRNGVMLPEPDFARRVAEFPPEGLISGVIETDDAFVIRLTTLKTESLLEAVELVIEKESRESWFAELSRNLDPMIPPCPGRYRLPAIDRCSTPAGPDSWKSLWYAPEPRINHTAVWTGSEMIVWGGESPSAAASDAGTGGRYNPATDTWIPTSTGQGCPSPRSGHTAVWTGSEMIVWGGGPTYGDPTNIGGRYNPLSNEWITTPTTNNCPQERAYHTAVWTGTEMIVWGGLDNSDYWLNSGGRFDPIANSWIATSTAVDCPCPRLHHTAVWTGTSMIVFGGRSYCPPWYEQETNTGGRYDPSTNAWEATSTALNCPEARSNHTTVWTGAEMVVWGGEGVDVYYLNSGGKYDPATNSWIAMSTTGDCPYGGYDSTAVWTGDEMIVFGGNVPSHTIFLGSGYKPTMNSWTSLPVTGSPALCFGHTAVWTGSEMIVYGGKTRSSYELANGGGRYDPVANAWVSLSPGTDLASPRRDHSTIWTGTEMIIWGGTGIRSLRTGSRYFPATDSWHATAFLTAAHCPTERLGHSAIWTGWEMIVWGGASDGNYANSLTSSGGRYNPVTNTWKPTARGGPDAPGPCWLHTAIWTGKEMIVWGGESAEREEDYTYYFVTVSHGARYNPLSDSWTFTSTGQNCPCPRHHHIAIWTGSKMIIWGGYGGKNPYGESYLRTGGRYDPLTNTWTATSVGPHCPAARETPTAIWTGDEMIVWGGYGHSSGSIHGHYFKDGGRYDPITDSWTSLSADTGRPEGRTNHTAIWTGLEMIVWGGRGFSPYPKYVYFNNGGRFRPETNSWAPMIVDESTPSARSGHTTVWTGQMMIIWDGIEDSSGGIFYPNTRPRAVPRCVTSAGGDATLALDGLETVQFDGSESTDGSNPATTRPNHDKLDSIVAYEWDLDGDAGYESNCRDAGSGVDLSGVTPPALTQADLAAAGIDSPGTYPIWLRVTDEGGKRDCGQVFLTVVRGSLLDDDVTKPRATAITH